MGDYASKGVAGSGLGLGIAGTALGLLNGNGLGGILGGNNSSLQAEIAQLKAEKYTDTKGVELYKQAKEDNNSLKAELSPIIASLAAEASNNKVEVAVLKEKLNNVAIQANNGISCLNTAVNNLATTVNNITKTVVPITAVCPQPMPAHNAWVAPTNTTTTPGA